MKKNSAFTLLEVMVAVSILAVGLIPISRALLGSLHVFHVYADHWRVQPWIEDKLWVIEDDFRRTGALPTGETAGQLTLDGRTWSWTMQVVLLDSVQEIYRIDINVAGSSKRRISRTKYMLAPLEEDTSVQPGLQTSRLSREMCPGAGCHG